MTLTPLIIYMRKHIILILLLAFACNHSNLNSETNKTSTPTPIKENTSQLEILPNPSPTKKKKITPPVNKKIETATPKDTARQYQQPSKNFFPNLSEQEIQNIFISHPGYIANSFDFPVGKPNAKSYYKARDFGEKRHLGEDWNHVNGGNSDYGDPVFSIANGVVVFSENVCCGWGRVIRVVHKVENDPEHEFVESIYAHLKDINVPVGEMIRKGQKIGTIGTANGKYTAHLHLELRNFLGMSLGPGYSDDTFGYLVPTEYINQHRGR